MSQTLWTAVDAYITEQLHEPDPALAAALKASEDAGLPPIQVSATAGKMLHLYALMVGARRILEIGTLGGYSTIWLGRALAAASAGAPSGTAPTLISLEADAHHAEVARKDIAQAGLQNIVEIRVGKAIDTLPLLQKEIAAGTPPFDMFFIDADKPSNAAYFGWAVKLARPGSLIVIDNVVRKGAVIDGKSADADIQGTRRMFEAVAAEKRVTATVLQTVSAKGYDGMLLAVVKL